MVKSKKEKLKLKLRLNGSKKNQTVVIVFALNCFFTRENASETKTNYSFKSSSEHTCLCFACFVLFFFYFI